MWILVRTSGFGNPLVRRTSGFFNEIRALNTNYKSDYRYVNTDNYHIILCDGRYVTDVTFCPLCIMPIITSKKLSIAAIMLILMTFKCILVAV